MSRRHEVVGTTLLIDHIHMYSFSSGQSNSTWVHVFHLPTFHLGRSVFPSLPPFFCRPSFRFSPRKSSFQTIDRHSTSPGCIHYITQSHLDFWDQNDQPVGWRWPPGAYWDTQTIEKKCTCIFLALFFNNLLFTCSVHVDKCDTWWYSMIFEQWIKVN